MYMKEVYLFLFFEVTDFREKHCIGGIVFHNNNLKLKKLSPNISNSGFNFNGRGYKITWEKQTPAGFSQESPGMFPLSLGIVPKS